MFLLALQSLSSAISPVAAEATLVSEADELNARYVECLFAEARDASENAVDEDRFSALLANSCNAERSRLHKVFLAVRQQRGASPSQAQAEWVRLEAEGRASVKRAYRVGRTIAE